MNVGKRKYTYFCIIHLSVAVSVDSWQSVIDLCIHSYICFFIKLKTAFVICHSCLYLYLSKNKLQYFKHCCQEHVISTVALFCKLPLNTDGFTNAQTPKGQSVDLHDTTWFLLSLRFGEKMHFILLLILICHCYYWHNDYFNVINNTNRNKK